MLLAFAKYDPQPDRCLVWAPSFSLAKTAAHGVFYRWHPIWCWRLKAEKGVIPLDVITDPTEAKHNEFSHVAKKPLRLMRRLVRAVVPNGGIVLDINAGSGTTVVAALAEERRVIGIEIDAEYVAMARKRAGIASMEIPTDEFQPMLFESTDHVVKKAKRSAKVKP